MKKTVIIKNEKEIQILRDLGKIHKEVFEEIKKKLKPGISGQEIDDLCFRICSKHNVICGFKGVYDFPKNLCISINDCVVHGIPSKKMIFKDSDVVKIDFGVKDKKYGLNTDAAFTVIIGDEKKDKKIEKFLKVSKEALYKGIAKATAGNKVGDISNAIQKHVESNGYKIIKDLTGHGVGYALHERPYIPNFGKSGTGEMLKKNMTLAIEPIVGYSSSKIIDKGGFEIYTEDGGLGAQFEHTIVVKSGYPEIIV